ncbi:LysR family transcriptional regulator [Microbacterium sp. SSM24]|uniref:LysR family transcriptional regulator n=1 Tax=Microbacterium sp. SSM24 TaxID=2991714 RepID=UPI00222789C2|nr:LysR family transcriptional regulator [Microbacterium sp. SSM24]MCW3492525.1 LysR family transcriptional regulator [Microbacterium sp. SSM24]
MPLPDLNQLRTFVVLYELRSLTATADRLHVTQPTVSYTLRQLRQRFGDDLFHRQGHVMVPTPRASRLFGPLHEALAQIDATVSSPDEFDPATFDGELALALTSIGEQTFLPPIMPALAQAAPHLHLKVERLDADLVADGLLRGTIDLAVTVSLMESPHLWRTPIRSVEYVALSSEAYPLPTTGPRMFEGRRFVRVSARGGHVYPLQAMIEQGLMPQVKLTVEEYATVPAVLEATDLVVLLPRHVADVFCGWFPGLRIAELPWPARSTPVAIYSRGEASLSPAQRWFRSVMFDAVAAGEYRVA